jgi:hypothetical protein
MIPLIVFVRQIRKQNSSHYSKISPGKRTLGRLDVEGGTLILNQKKIPSFGM